MILRLFPLPIQSLPSRKTYAAHPQAIDSFFIPTHPLNILMAFKALKKPFVHLFFLNAFLCVITVNCGFIAKSAAPSPFFAGVSIGNGGENKKRF